MIIVIAQHCEIKTTITTFWETLYYFNDRPRISWLSLAVGAGCKSPLVLLAECTLFTSIPVCRLVCLPNN